MIRRNKIVLACLIFITIASSVRADLPKEQLYSLFNQANQSFRQGNSADNPEQAKKDYQQAILSYERIINEGGIRNARLYYNLANAYFLQGRIGKAILNYRRAEKLGNDSDIEKNLTFARSQRKDQVTVKTEKRVLQTLFFWHYDFAQKTRFLLMCVSFAIVCLTIIAGIWFHRNAPITATAIIFGILTICLLSSVVVDARTRANNVGGVITAPEVVAYQGDGQNYPPSFKEPLHEGTEFNLIERRSGWFHIRLSDDSDGWIPETRAELI